MPDRVTRDHKKRRSPWRRFWRGLADFALRAAGEDERRGGANVAPPPSPGEKTAPAASTPAGFTSQLKTVLKAQGNATAGALHVIDLAKLKDRFGDDWPRAQQRIDAVARNVIERRLSAADMYVAQEGPVYVILFSALTVEVARAKCALMASEIERRLLGEGHSEEAGLNVRAAVAKLGPKLSVDRIDVKSVVQEVMTQGRDATRPRKARMPGDAAEALSAAEQAASRGAAAVPAGTDADEGGEQEAPGWQALEGRYHDGYFPPIDFSYAPMWDVRNQAVAVFHCLPMAQDPVYGGQKTLSFSRPMQALKLDLMSLHKVLRDLKDGFDHNRPFILSFAIHFMTLSDPKMRTQFLQVASRIRPDYAKRLTCEVINIPDGVPGVQMYEAIAAIKPHVRWVTLRLHLGETLFSRYTGLRVTSVGIDLSQTRASEADLLKKLESFVEGAGHCGLRTYVHGVRSRSLTVGILCAGVDYVSGELIGGAVSAPDAMYRFRTQDIYSALIADAAAEVDPGPDTGATAEGMAARRKSPA